MLKTLKNIRRRDTDKFMIPHSVQEVIPIHGLEKRYFACGAEPL